LSSLRSYLSIIEFCSCIGVDPNLSFPAAKFFISRVSFRLLMWQECWYTTLDPVSLHVSILFMCGQLKLPDTLHISEVRYASWYNILCKLLCSHRVHLVELLVFILYDRNESKSLAVEITSLARPTTLHRYVDFAMIALVKQWPHSNIRTHCHWSKISRCRKFILLFRLFLQHV
jgi:hypothetical protein